jgi:type II secretion system protein H
MFRSAQRSGFTLIELLVVITIFGVMVAIIGISISASSTTTQVRSAARGFVQLSRYARTMAVLHQKPMLFSFSESGLLSVTPRDGGGQNYSLVSSRSFASTNTLADQEEAERAESAAREEMEGGQSESMSDIQLERSCEQVKFVFKEYADTIEDGWYARTPISAPPSADTVTNTVDVSSSRHQIIYRSNGTCRPYRVEVSSLDEDKPYTLNITIDRLGVASIDEDMEDER